MRQRAATGLLSIAGDKSKRFLSDRIEKERKRCAAKREKCEMKPKEGEKGERGREECGTTGDNERQWGTMGGDGRRE